MLFSAPLREPLRGAVGRKTLALSARLPTRLPTATESRLSSVRRRLGVPACKAAGTESFASGKRFTEVEPHVVGKAVADSDRRSLEASFPQPVDDRGVVDSCTPADILDHRLRRRLRCERVSEREDGRLPVEGETTTPWRMSM